MIGEVSDSFPYDSTKFDENSPAYISQNTLEKYLGDNVILGFSFFFPCLGLVQKFKYYILIKGDLETKDLS